MDSKNISELESELQAVIDWFGSGQVNIDEAESKYRHGLELATEIKKKLKVKTNNIIKLKESFDKIDK